MREICFLLSFVLLMAGAGFLFAPGRLTAINRWLNTILLTDERAVIHRGIAGVVMALLGLIILWVAWRMR